MKSKNKPHHWTKQETLFVKNFWQEKPDAWLAEKLKLPILVVENKRRAMMLIRQSNRWSNTDITYVREHYPFMTDKQIACELDRTVGSVQQIAYRYRITNKRRKQTI